MDSAPAFRAHTTTNPRGYRLEGEVDLSNARVLADLLDPAVQAGGDLTLDLSGITFMDSTAIQVLLQAGKQIHDKGTLILYRPGALVANVLKLIKADHVRGIEIVGAEETG